MANPDNVRQFSAVEIPDDLPDNAYSSKVNDVAAAALALGLKTLSQRAIAGSRALFTLASVASCFWLWNNTPDPSYTQIVSLSLYALFVLAANVIVRRV